VHSGIRVALLSAEYPPQPGGVGDYTWCLAQAVTRRDNRVVIITIRDGQLLLLPAGGHDPQLPDRCGLHRWDWRCWGATIAALDRLRPDLLHIQYQTGAYGMHPAINLLPWRLRGLSGRPRVVVTFHDLLEPYLFPKAGPLRRYVTGRLARDADRVIVTNAEDAANIRQQYQPLRRPLSVTTIPIGSNIPVAPPPFYDRAAWRAALGVGPHDFLIAYFGLLSPSKGVDRLIEAIAGRSAGLRWSVPPRLLLIGGGATASQDRAYAAGVQAQITRLGVGHQVIRTGQVDAATVSAHLLAADCVALPFQDGASFRRGSLLAALSHGAAVITTTPTAPASAAPVRLIHGEHVYLVPPNDSVALATALQHLAHDEATRIRLGRAAGKLAEQFTWDAIALQHEQLYASLSQSGVWPLPSPGSVPL
jgi:polysaccharide biosynthesis protein PslF